MKHFTMWSKQTNVTKEECIQTLRKLELEAYSSLVSALRAQGPLNLEKRTFLKETSKFLNITIDRHKAEVRRAINDEKLASIAYHIHGSGMPLDDWIQEGRRMMPLLQRISPQSTYPVFNKNDRAQMQQSVLSSITERKKSQSAETMLSRQQNVENANALLVPITENATDQTKNEIENQDVNLKSPSVKSNHSFCPTNGNQLTFTANIEKPLKICSTRKAVNKGQKLMIVSNTQTIPTNSILQKTLSLPMSKVTKLNLEKFKIVSNSHLPSTIQVTTMINADNSKQKMFSSKSGKKVIPLSQFQMLNHRIGSKIGIKVLPLTGKILGKNVTMTRIPQTSTASSTSRLFEVLKSTTFSQQEDKDVKESEQKIIEDTKNKNNSEDVVIENGNATSEYITTKNVVEIKREEYENNIKTEQDCNNKGDLDSLMEIDSSDLIESEIKDSEVKQEPAKVEH